MFIKVLLVFSKEDNQLLALKSAIQKRGYLIRWSKSLEDACDAFIDYKYDLVFIDSRNINDIIKFDYENICRYYYHCFNNNHFLNPFCLCLKVY
jgi:hypothetical protein